MPAPPPGFLHAFARWAAAPGSCLSATALRESRLSLVDTLACLHAGREEPPARAALAAMRAGGADGPVRGWPGGGLSAPAAALVNGVAMHALDFDDYEVPGSTHPGAPIFGALLALAGLRETGLGELLQAHGVGYEMICRVGEALGYGHYLAGWHATSTIGALGAAAAGARLLRLPADAFAAALSLATSMAAGSKAQFGSDAKPLQAGLAARAGVECALLAAAGVGAQADVLEVPHGFLARYGGAGSPGFDGVAARLGRPCALDQYPVLRKPWPCCAYTHRVLEAAEALMAEEGVTAAEVAAGVIRVPEPFARVAGIARPRTPAEARFSLAYCVATLLLDGRLGVASFTPEAVSRADTAALVSRLALQTWDPGPGIVDMSPQAPDTLMLRLLDGSERTRTVAEVRGGMTRPLSQAQLLAKFTDCGGTPALAERVLGGPASRPFGLHDALATAG